MPVTNELGDICTATTEAVVNPANEHLINGAGVAGALRNRVGFAWQRDCDAHVRAQGPLRPYLDGHVWLVPDTNRVPFRAIVSVVGPRRTEPDVYGAARQTLRTALDLMVVRGFKSISVPAISSGLFGCPIEVVAEALVHEAWIHPNLDIRFRNWDVPTYEAMARAIQEG